VIGANMADCHPILFLRIDRQSRGLDELLDHGAEPEHARHQEHQCHL